MRIIKKMGIAILCLNISVCTADDWISAIETELLEKVPSALVSRLVTPFITAIIDLDRYSQKDNYTQTLQHSNDARNNFLKSINEVLRITRLANEAAAMRPAVVTYYRTMLSRYPHWYSDNSQFNPDNENIAAWMLLRLKQGLISIQRQQWRGASELMELYYIGSDRSAIWHKHRIVLFDNRQLDQRQIQFVDDILQNIPKGLYRASGISVGEYFGKAPNTIRIHDLEYSINIFGNRIGQFQQDFLVGSADTFCVGFIHELSHLIERDSISRNMKLNRRLKRLRRKVQWHTEKGLRWDLPYGFFKQHPQEFFAAISIPWFVDSEVTLNTALRQQQMGNNEPLKQALFMANIFSEESKTRYLFRLENGCELKRRNVQLAYQ